MSASEPMDVDPRPSEKCVQEGSGDGEVKVASFDGVADSHETGDSNPPPRHSGPCLPGLGYQGKPGSIPSAGGKPSRNDAVASNASNRRPTPVQNTQDTSRRDSSPDIILDEIVVATRRRSPSQDESQSSDENEKSEARFVPVTPAKHQSPETRRAAKASDVDTTQARFELKDDEAAVTATGRNPKRDAAEMAEPQAMEAPEHEELLDAALAPMKAEELDEWEGWVELESEPVRPLCPRIKTIYLTVI